MEKREHAGIFLFAVQRQMLAVWVFLCASDGKRAPALRALWLGLVASVSLVCQRQVILVRFPSKQQTDTRPFELLQFAKKTMSEL